MNQNYNDSNNGFASTSGNGRFQETNLPGFVFKSALSLEPLIELWKRYESDTDPIRAACAKNLLAELKNAPELAGRIEDLSVIEKHAGLVTQLMSIVFPPAYWEEMLAAAVVPFQIQPFHATPRFKRLNLVKDGRFSRGMNVDEEHMRLGKTLNAYSHILRKFYGIETNFEYPLIFTCVDEQTGLARHHKVTIDLRFVEIKKVADTKPLEPEDAKRLLANPTNLGLWLELIPPHCFEFRGFVVFNAVDVTDHEVLSSIKNDLLEKGAIISMTRFESLEEKLRTLLQRPDLKLGLAGIPGAQNLLREHGRKIGQSFILSEACRHQCATFSGSIYDRAITHGEIVIVEDLSAYASPTPVEEQILEQGVRNIFIAPLYWENQLMGLLELGSPNPGDINAMNALKLKDVLSLFSIAVKRSMEEMNDRIEAVIKEKCTAIHSAVEWRFRRAALKYLHDQQEGDVSEMEPIVFDEVYPLYGLSDIRGSSTLRNDAIRADLIEHLDLAREIILLAHHHKPLPFLAQLIHRIGQQLKRIENGLSSGDEVNIIEFLQREIEPHFDHFQEFGSAVGEKIQAYRAALDPQLGVIFRERKNLEESVSQLNETIAGYIDAEQEKAQALFPHYFEKFKSDGVDHGIYIGASLVENGKFDLLYLKNIRLWQLMLLCGVARQAESLKPKLKVPLEMAHLILVQNMPLAIRFRYDEKKFDVDGAYNARYEIMKKRIDKAVIKGTGERLTQPGKIAIVYSQAREASEYVEYIDYLQASGYLTDELEEFELEDLQGMHGLRALRVTVNMQASVIKPPIKPKEARPAAKEMALEIV
jgi:hypothetical protein